ncbi:MAG TPA: carboxylating nicotinate-nucleotide diphosphorylase [Gemmatimonadaceae bacterium]|nr:carboxylating nicotinate-nucleotide diphosphorylase [Gemmatimonadaceae bacterium]
MTSSPRRKPRVITPSTTGATLADDRQPFPLTPAQLDALVRGSLEEDGAFDDVTTIATVQPDRTAHGTIVSRSKGVIAGVPVALAAFKMLDPSIAIRIDSEDADRVAAGASIMRLSGAPRALLSAERVALNFLQRLSGIATLTARFVEAVRGTGARIFDTRKTTPGLRRLEKYAVRAGGGENHRMGLFDQVLIKDNHLAILSGDVGLAVRRAREYAPVGMRVEVECDSIDQVAAAVEAGVDIVLLDNMSPPMLRQAVQLVARRAIIEASGGVTLDTVRAIAETGVDWISVGALTHSAPALDLALEFGGLSA